MTSKTQKLIMGMQSTFKFGKHKGVTIKELLDERCHDNVHYLLWIQKKINIEYTKEVQEELIWQDEYVPKHNYSKIIYLI